MSSPLEAFLQRWEQRAARLEAGKQAFRDGRLFIADPLDIEAAKTPITAATPAGVFPVVVYQHGWMHHRSQPRMLVNTFLAVEFSTLPPVSWEQVEAETTAFVYPTDFTAEFGNMAIMDGATRSTLIARCAEVENAYDDFLAPYMDPEPGQKRRLVFEFPLGKGFDLIACESGAGNGHYPAFLGRDNSGAPAILAVDFEIDDRG